MLNEDKGSLLLESQSIFIPLEKSTLPKSWLLQALLIIPS